MFVDLSAGIAQDGFGGTDTLVNIEHVRGSELHSDTLIGDAGDNTLDGRAGDDTLIGGEGTDTAKFQGNLSDYEITENADGTITVTDTVAGRDDRDVLSSIETLQFADGSHPVSDFATPEGPDAVISGELSGSVTEDVSVDANGDLVASGQLAITDDDAGEAFFNAATVSGAHGSLTIDADGAWTYEVDNDLPAVQTIVITKICRRIRVKT